MIGGFRPLYFMSAINTLLSAAETGVVIVSTEKIMTRLVIPRYMYITSDLHYLYKGCVWTPKL